MYEQYINHTHRTAFIFAIDCSASMQEKITFNSLTISKSEAVALVCNYMLDELIARATREDEVRNYYDIAVIGYSGEGVKSMLPTRYSPLIAINALAEHTPTAKEFRYTQLLDNDTSTTATIRLHQWITPLATGLTPMYEALQHIEELVRVWCSKHENRASFPPMIFNITDGECSDGTLDDMRNIAERIKSHATADGNVLFMNIHLSTDKNTPSVTMPEEYSFQAICPFRRTLFNMSSILPVSMEELITDLLHPYSNGPYRCVAFNASINELLMILDIGSQSIRHA